VSVAVYPRLEHLLRERGLSVSELMRRMQDRYGMTFDPKTLYRLAGSGPIQRADLTIAGAAAAVLGVGLDDLFQVEAISVHSPPQAQQSYLSPDQSRRLAELFDRQADGLLAEPERAELNALVAEYGRQFQETTATEVARQRGIPVEEVQRQADERVGLVGAWWEQTAADPRRRRAYVASAKRRRAEADSDGRGSRPARSRSKTGGPQSGRP
jgi:hypothetical protein